MLLDLPRQDFELPTLHELVRDAAEAGNVLTEETADIDVRVTFPEDLDGTAESAARGLVRAGEGDGLAAGVADASESLKVGETGFASDSGGA
jgi:hypothetical protein